MKKAKYFDYDKRSPNVKEYRISTENNIENKGKNMINNSLNTSVKNADSNRKLSKNTLNLKTTERNFTLNGDKRKQKENNFEGNASNFGVVFLPESEIIMNDEALKEEEMHNDSFNVEYIKSYYFPLSLKIDPAILDGVHSSLTTVLDGIKQEISDDKLTIPPEKNPLKFSDDVPILPSPIRRSNSGKIEKSLRMQKIKDLNRDKEFLKMQISKIDKRKMMLEEENRVVNRSRSLNSGKIDEGNLRGEIFGVMNSSKNLNVVSGLDNSPPFSLSSPKSLVDENIKRDRLKEDKQTREILLQKLNGINEQVQKLMDEEAEERGKRVNLKEFLDNFEKDKEIIEKRTRKMAEEKKRREIRIMESVRKDNEKLMKEKEEEEEEEERRRKEVEKMRLKELERIREKNKENVEKLNYIKQYMNEKPATKESDYLFRQLENKYKEKEQHEIQIEIMKHKAKLKEQCVSLEELNEFEKQQKQYELKRLSELEEEKRKLKEQWKLAKDSLPKFESSLMQKVKEEELKLKEQKEQSEFKKKIKQQEQKNYSEAVQKLFLPRISESKVKEREERIKNLVTKGNVQKLTKKKNNGRVILVKMDENRKKKYGWKLKLEPEPTNESSFKKNKSTENVLRAQSGTKRKPLNKLPDYLTEMRLEKNKADNSWGTSSSHSKFRAKNWFKMIKNGKGSLLENVEMIKIKAEELENQAKRKELLMNNGGELDPEMQQKVSDLYIESIKAKLAILDSVNS